MDKEEQVITYYTSHKNATFGIIPCVFLLKSVKILLLLHSNRKNTNRKIIQSFIRYLEIYKTVAYPLFRSRRSVFVHFMNLKCVIEYNRNVDRTYYLFPNVSIRD